MGRADLEWEFTSFSKGWGDQDRTDPAIFSLLSKAKQTCFQGEISYMVELDSSSTL